MKARTAPSRPTYELPALLGRLLLPGESVMESLTWQEHRAAIEAARRGDRRVVALPTTRVATSPQIATLAEVVRVAIAAGGRMAHAEVVGVRRVRVLAAAGGHPYPCVRVSDIASPAPMRGRQPERLRALIARANADGAGHDLDLTGVGPADRVDLLSAHLVTSEAVKRAVLRSPTLEGRLRKLERWVSRPKPRGFAENAPDFGVAKEDDRLAALPEAIREAVEREREEDDSRAFGHTHAAIDAILAIKWEAPPQAPIDLRRARRLLDETHGGAALEGVKQAVLDRLGLLEWRRREGLPPGSGDAPGILLVGAPGTGKTSLAKSISAATDRRLEIFAVGSTTNVTLAGLSRSYMNAGPGDLVKRLMASGRHPSECVFVLDELDKIDQFSQYSPLPVLLAWLDPVQGEAFQDAFLGPSARLDCSGTIWVSTANVVTDIPAPLRDRLQVLQLPGYTQKEQVAIARDFLLPRLFKRLRIGEQVEVPAETVEALVTGYPPSEGMRQLEQRLVTVVARALREHLLAGQPVRVDPGLARSWVPSSQAERRIGFHVQTSGITPRPVPGRVTPRAPAVSLRRRLRRSSRSQPEVRPARPIGGAQS